MSDGRDEPIAVLMSDMSEDLFCAGWLIGLEFDLWARVEQVRRFGACSGWGFADSQTMTELAGALIAEIDQSGMWACWDDGKGGVIVVPVDDWEVLFWATAPAHSREIASSAPTCGVRGEMVTDPDAVLGVWFPDCKLPARHEGEHQFDA